MLTCLLSQLIYYPSELIHKSDGIEVKSRGKLFNINKQVCSLSFRRVTREFPMGKEFHYVIVIQVHERYVDCIIHIEPFLNIVIIASGQVTSY